MDQVETTLMKNWTYDLFGPLKWPLANFLFDGLKSIKILTFFILVKMFNTHPVKQNLGGRFFEEVDGVLRILCTEKWATAFGLKLQSKVPKIHFQGREFA